jgi:hypothetical protein
VSIHRFAVASLGMIVAVVGAVAAPAPPKDKPKEPVLPDAIFRDIVKEANQFIQKPLTAARKESPKPRGAGGYYSAARSNALLIALAAQNRMADPDADAKQLATLRDTAVNLAEAVKQSPPNLDKVLKLADLLNQYPELKADPNARTGRVQLKDTFTHDEITVLFGGCSGRSGHAIQADLLAFGRKRLPYSDEDEAKIERLAYKVALLVGFDKEFAPDIPTKPGSREKWVRMASEVETASWALTEMVRVADHEDIKKKVSVIFSGCATCHVSFRD